MTDDADAKKLKHSLRKMGLTDAAINIAWPEWWSNDAEGSASAKAELRFSLARKLGIDPRSLIDDGEPHFVWRDEAKYKHLTTESELERAAIASFGISIARALTLGIKEKHRIEGEGPTKLRESILKNAPYVKLSDLLGLVWAVGIPVIHLRVFPLSAKHMCAMTVRVKDSYVILLGKDADYPAPIAFYLAHELGHIALDHFKDRPAIVDFQDPFEPTTDIDSEEAAADRFGLELLTGSPTFKISTEARSYRARQLAHLFLTASEDLHIEPGTLAMCFGHSTGEWAKVQAAMKLIYTQKLPVWKEVNKIAFKQLDWGSINDDLRPFLSGVMGGNKINHESSYR